MRRFHVGIFRRVKPTASIEEYLEAFELAQEAAQEVEDFFRWYARDRWDIRVEGYAYRGEQSTQPPTYAQDDVKAFIAGHDMEGFDPNYFHVWGGYKGGICGQGRLPGNWSVTYFNVTTDCGVKTMIHELGHNLGVWHASTLKDGADNPVTYGDKTSIMSDTRDIVGFHGPNLLKLDLEDSREYGTISRNYQALLCPIELEKHDMHPGELQHVRFRADSMHELSIRKNKGSRYLPTRMPADTLYVHKVGSMEDVRLLPDLEPGDSRVLDNKVTVEYVAYQNETAKVNIKFHGDDREIEDKFFPPRLPEAPVTNSITEAHTGLWYNPDFDGEGFDIQVKGDRVVLYWYTYSQILTERRFYWAEGTKSQFEVGTPIYTTRNGTWENPTQSDVEDIGEVQLYFFDEHNGIVRGNTSEHGRFSVEVQPVALSVSDLTGVYFDFERDGEGFTIEAFRNDEQLIALWYSYKERGGQCWYYCDGTRRSDGSYKMVFYEAPEGKWMHLRDNPKLVAVGAGSLVSTDSGLLISGTINSEGVNDSFEFNLERLF